MKILLTYIVTIGVAASFAGDALAKVMLPKDAKRLDNAGIIALYGGKAVLWAPPGGNMTGTVIFDAAMTSSKGTWIQGKNHGTFKGVVAVESDLYCYTVTVNGKVNPKTCVTVNQAGDKIYETNPTTGAVTSVNSVVH